MIAIINYNAGNISSVANTLKRLGSDCLITADFEKIKRAEKVILPGVGHAGAAMEYLREKQLDKLIRNLTQPVLGICLGQQLFCNYSEEGNTKCMGIYDVEVKKFPPNDIVPHMGWNNLTETKVALFSGITPADDVYFVHGYYAEICPDTTTAVSDYILPFSAAMQKNNFYATQFHPEKSGDVGERILTNFLNL